MSVRKVVFKEAPGSGELKSAVQSPGLPARALFARRGGITGAREFSACWGAIVRARPRSPEHWVAPRQHESQEQESSAVHAAFLAPGRAVPNCARTPCKFAPRTAGKNGCRKNYLSLNTSRTVSTGHGAWAMRLYVTLERKPPLNFFPAGSPSTIRSGRSVLA